MGSTRRLLERVPGDKLAWKPHDKSMSLGGLATHIGRIPQWAATILNEPSFDLAEAPPDPAEHASLAGILSAFRSLVLHHIIHHRGQLSVYLRLNDVAVPAIYGPSADEGS